MRRASCSLSSSPWVKSAFQNRSCRGFNATLAVVDKLLASAELDGSRWSGRPESEIKLT